MRIVIYYRSMPRALEDYIAHDRDISLTKDGAATYEGLQCARAIIMVTEFNDHTDKERLSKLMKVLETLEQNNQIFAFSILKK